VTQRIIDGLEPIKIEAQQSEQMAGLLNLLECPRAAPETGCGLATQSARHDEPNGQSELRGGDAPPRQ
jgi:hypothetical protein